MTSCFSAGLTIQSELPGVPGTQQCWSRKSSGFDICICLLQEKRIRENYHVQIILEVQQRRDLIRFYGVHFFHMQTFPLVQFLTLLSHLNFSSHTEAAALDPLLYLIPLTRSFASLTELQFSTDPPQPRSRSYHAGSWAVTPQLFQKRHKTFKGTYLINV